MPDEDSIQRLVSLLQQGDSEGPPLFQTLFRDPLLRFCWGYLASVDEAEDALQEITYKVLTATTVPDHFRAWVYKLARNQCLNLVRDRKRRRDRAAAPPDSQLRASATGNLTRLVHSEVRARLAELLRSLPERQREALRLRYVEGLSRVEMAEVLDVPESVVKSRLFEGIKSLRAHADVLESR